MSSPILDSVKALSLNSSANATNTSKTPAFTIRNICCVGAGYVGTSSLRALCHLNHISSCQTNSIDSKTSSQAVLPRQSSPSKTLTSKSPSSTVTRPASAAGTRDILPSTSPVCMTLSALPATAAARPSSPTTPPTMPTPSTRTLASSALRRARATCSLLQTSPAAFPRPTLSSSRSTRPPRSEVSVLVAPPT